MYSEQYQPERYILLKFGKIELTEAKRGQSCGDAYSSLLLVIPTKYCHKSVCLWISAGATNRCAHFGSLYLRMINFTKYK